MTPDFTTDTIDRLRAEPLDAPRGWRVTFRSGQTAHCHQLYVNGRLADWTDEPKARGFVLSDADHPRELVVAAVDPAMRKQDFSDRLPEPIRRPGWVFETVLLPKPWRPGDTLALLGDGTTGELNPAPLLTLDARPPWSAGWGFGLSAFGDGGFGLGAGADGSSALGFGRGAFGAGPFGLDAHAPRLRAALSGEGEHRLVLRATAPGGDTAETELPTFTACPPPAPPSDVRADAYDPNTNTITLTWST